MRTTSPTVGSGGSTRTVNVSPEVGRGRGIRVAVGVGDRVAVGVGLGVDGGIGVGEARFPATIIAIEVALRDASTVAAGTVGDLGADDAVAVGVGVGVGDGVGVADAARTATLVTAAAGVGDAAGVAVSMAGDAGAGLGASVGGIAVSPGCPPPQPARTRGPATSRNRAMRKATPPRCSALW